MNLAVYTRDDFAKLLFRDDFFAANPAFAAVQQILLDCKAAYVESAAKSSCGCGGSARTLFDCMDATIALMETMRTENPAALTTLLDYVRNVRGDQRIDTIALYYRKTAETPLLKIRFP